MAGTFTAKYKELRPSAEDVWIETGTWRGAAVANALRYGFRELHTIEVKQETFLELESSHPELCSNPNVHRYLGSSRDLLYPIVERVIDRDVVFWLDGHYSGEPGQRDSVSECPLLAELQAILDGRWTRSVMVCIDDAYLFDDRYWISGALRHTFRASEWPRFGEILQLMLGWCYHREDDILYFWKDFR